MELDNLKQVWKEQDLSNKPADDEQIRLMLQKRSMSPIAKMKRNLFVELIFVIVLYTASIAYYLITKHARYWAVALLLFLVGLFFIFYYYRKNKLLKEMECVTCEVKSNLQRQVLILEKYVRFYFLSGVILTPVAYFTSGFLVAYESDFKMSADNSFLIWFFGVGILLILSSFFLNRWYVKKLYGQHVEKLKQLLKQTEETL